MEGELESQINGILNLHLGKNQTSIALQVIKQLYEGGCFARSGKQLPANAIKADAPRATVYRIVKTLERHGFIDRESRFSGYFLSHKFANESDERARNWRKICSPKI